jgi:diguanylate cyclase (GGDEF)-like protein
MRPKEEMPMQDRPHHALNDTARRDASGAQHARIVPLQTFLEQRATMQDASTRLEEFRLEWPSDDELELRLAARIRDLELANARLQQELAESHEARQRSWHAAHHDPLTGLANRLLLNDRVEHVMQLARRQKKAMAVIYMDLDRFKQINDTLGHEVGDRFLCEVASRLRRSVRASDLVARVGGDEFVIVLEELHHKDDAQLVAQKILDTLAQPVAIGDHRLKAAASMGISHFPEHGADAATLMRCADAAMYRAKAEGRNGIRIFDASMSDAAGGTR